MHFIQRQCPKDDCRFRYPAPHKSDDGMLCPLCGTLTKITTASYQHRQPANHRRQPVRELHLLLDNFRSTYNVGSIFRTADGAGITHIYTCGITPPPDHKKVAKTALGAEKTVGWSVHNNAPELAAELQDKGILLWGLEGAETAKPLFETPLPSPERPLILIIGSEVAGIDPHLLAMCDQIVSLPMLGHKESLNASVATGIAAYWLTSQN